jgi:hypothetical protein
MSKTWKCWIGLHGDTCTEEDGNAVTMKVTCLDCGKVIDRYYVHCEGGGRIY